MRSIINNTRDLLNSISKIENEINGISNDIRHIKSAKATITQPTDNQLLTWNEDLSMVEDSLWQLPAADGAANEILYTDAAGNLNWIAPGAAAVAGADTQVQYNAGGVMAAEAAFTYNYNTNTLTADHIQATIDFSPDVADGATLGTAALEFSDAYFADGSVIYFGDDQDVTLTHIPDQSINLNLSLVMVSTTTAYTGVIYKGANRFLHDFHHPTGGGAIPEGHNTFIGELAGNFTMGAAAAAVTDASNNVCIGYGSGRVLDLGHDNLGLGSYSLYNCDDGYHNSAIGRRSMQLLTDGTYNSGFGTYSLYSANDDYNTGCVAYTAYLLATGSYNAIFGAYSFAALTSGGSNVGFGTNAGRYTSALAANQLCNNSIFIGWRARANANNETNQIVLGYDAIGLGSNTQVLGNANIVTTRIYGDVQIDSDTDMLIVGDGQDAGIYYNGTNMVFNSQLVGAGDFYFANGDIGVHTAVPACEVHAYGTEAVEIRVEGTANTSYPLFGLGTDNNTRAAFMVAYGSAHAAQADELSLKNLYGDITFYPGVAGVSTLRFTIQSDGGIYMHALKSGATQAAAGAAANELWFTSGHVSLPDNVVMIGA